jgi:hypothetical protein
MNRKRHGYAAPHEAGQDEGQIREELKEPGTAPGDLIAPGGELTAAAAELTSQAGEGREYAGQRRATAAALMAAARTEAEAIIGQAEAKAREIGTSADAREREAHDLEEHARKVVKATELRTQAEAKEHQAEALTVDRGRLKAELAALDARSEQLIAQRGKLVSELGAARASGDLAGMTSARNGIQSIDDLAVDVAAPRSGMVSRLDRLGDPDGPGELSDTVTRGRALRADFWLALDALLGEDEEDSEPLSRPAVLQAIDEETARHARTFAAERAVLAALADELSRVLPQLADEAAELGRREAVAPAMRTMDSALNLRYRIEALQRFTASVSGALTAARTCLDQLAAAGPADLVNVLDASRRARQQIRRLLATEREPLPGDDLSNPVDVLRGVAQAMAEEAQKPKPVPEPRRRLVVG